MISLHGPPYAHGLKAVATNQRLNTKTFEEEIPNVEQKAYAYAAERRALKMVNCSRG